MDVPKNMRNYFLCLLLKGERWNSAESPENEELQERHLAHIRRQVVQVVVRDAARLLGQVMRISAPG